MARFILSTGYGTRTFSDYDAALEAAARAVVEAPSDERALVTVYDVDAGDVRARFDTPADLQAIPSGRRWIERKAGGPQWAGTRPRRLR